MQLQVVEFATYLHDLYTCSSYEQGGPELVSPQMHLLRVASDTECVAHALEGVAHEIEFVASMEVEAIFTSVIAPERVYLMVWMDDYPRGGPGSEGEGALSGEVRRARCGRSNLLLWHRANARRRGVRPKAEAEEAHGKLVEGCGLTETQARIVLFGAWDKLTREGEPLDTKRCPYSKWLKVRCIEYFYEPRHCTGGGHACTLYGGADRDALMGSAWSCARAARDGNGGRRRSDESLVG